MIFFYCCWYFISISIWWPKGQITWQNFIIRANQCNLQILIAALKVMINVLDLPNQVLAKYPGHLEFTKMYPQNYTCLEYCKTSQFCAQLTFMNFAELKIATLNWATVPFPFLQSQVPT